MKITSKLLASTLIAALTTLAGNAAGVIVGNGALPPPTAPQGGYEGGAGAPGAAWPNNAPAGQQGVMAGSSYNPLTNILTLNNIANAANTKQLWIRVVTDRQQAAGYNPPRGGGNGQNMAAGAWGVATAPGPAGNVKPTGASARFEAPAPNGRPVLVFYQTWDITPQPASESIDLSNLVANLRSRNVTSTIVGIQALSQCTPTPLIPRGPGIPAPGPVALGGLGLLMVAHRRRA